MQEFTISVYTENQIGMLNKVSIIFNRRHINIESLTVSESEIPGIHRYTIVVITDEPQIKKVTKQLTKQVDVVKAFYYSNDEIVYQEIALFKLPTSSFTQGNAEVILRNHHSRILAVTEEYIVVEKTGYKEEIQALYKELEPFRILEYISSGRVAISKRMKELRTYLDEIGSIEDYSLIM